MRRCWGHARMCLQQLAALRLFEGLKDGLCGRQVLVFHLYVELACRWLRQVRLAHCCRLAHSAPADMPSCHPDCELELCLLWLSLLLRRRRPPSPLQAACLCEAAV